LFRFIPWDVWLALALAAIVLCVEAFESLQTVFVILYGMLCAYIIVSAFTCDEER
jgi:hypothetical protein